jgi:hypothetical protein
MSHYSLLGAAVIAASAFTLCSCAPDTSPADNEVDASNSQLVQSAAADSSPTEGGNSTAPATPTSPTKGDFTQAIQDPDPPTRLFDLIRDGDRLVLSGRIRSEMQAQDIAAALQIEGLTLENKLEVDPKTPGVDWGNRVDEFLPQLVSMVPDLHFHVEDGVITLNGTVKSEQEKNQLQRDVVYVMESPLIRGLKNQLKIEGSGNE